MSKFKNQVSRHSTCDAIPQHAEHECARCQMLEVKIEQLQKLIQGWDKTEAEIKAEALKSVLQLQKPLLPNCNVVTVFDIEKRIKEFDCGNLDVKRSRSPLQDVIYLPI